MAKITETFSPWFVRNIKTERGRYRGRHWIRREFVDSAGETWVVEMENATLAVQGSSPIHLGSIRGRANRLAPAEVFVEGDERPVVTLHLDEVAGVIDKRCVVGHAVIGETSLGDEQVLLVACLAIQHFAGTFALRSASLGSGA